MEVFQREAQEELDHVTRQAQVLQTAPTSHLSRLLTRGESLGIEVPEVDQLRVVSQTAQHTLVFLQSVHSGSLAGFSLKSSNQRINTCSGASLLDRLEIEELFQVKIFFPALVFVSVLTFPCLLPPLSPPLSPSPSPSPSPSSPSPSLSFPLPCSLFPS